MMNQPLWCDVDGYFNAGLGGEDPALRAALDASRAAGLPSIAVSASQGKILMILAKSVGARRILEIGTLGGYSAIWLARALPPGGRLISLELEGRHAALARANLEAAGLSDVAEVRVGPASESLAALAAAAPEPFDFVFIDADKPSNALYFGFALKMTRPGALIIIDNVVRGGDVVRGGQDPNVAGVRAVVELIGRTPEVEAAALQTVGDKGYDGFLMARVL